LVVTVPQARDSFSNEHLHWKRIYNYIPLSANDATLILFSPQIERRVGPRNLVAPSRFTPRLFDTCRLHPLVQRTSILSKDLSQKYQCGRSLCRAYNSVTVLRLLLVIQQVLVLPLVMRALV
jgi:hypothetical protein